MKEEKVSLHKKEVISSFGFVFITIIWGSSFVVMKNSVSQISPIYLMAVRFSIGGLALAVIFFSRLKNINKSIVWPGIVCGFWLSISYIIQTYGLKYTTASNNAFITTLYVIIVPFMNFLFYRVKIHRKSLVAAVLAVVGIGFLSLNSGISHVNIGDVLTLICSFCYGIQILFIDTYTKKHDPINLTMIQLPCAAIICWVLAFILEGKLSLNVFSSDLVGSLFYLGIFASAVCFSIQNIGQKYVPAATASILLSLESVFGVIFAIALLGEPLTLRILIGFILIFIAVLLSESSKS
ncbi:DMT family transporter [Lacrimispora sp.]|uniref:DMT family transporter n=1 Tax=Lacrimispora sp. TaxID=2719234 RepID=UPI00289B91AA|nr:DMT family transporter [Lacrimispora sp.]